MTCYRLDNTGGSPGNMQNKRRFLLNNEVVKGHRAVNHSRHRPESGFFPLKAGCTSLIVTDFGESSRGRPKGIVGLRLLRETSEEELERAMLNKASAHALRQRLIWCALSATTFS
jgi:hypothetical protein